MEKWVKIRFYGCLVLIALTAWMISPTLWSLSHPDTDKKMPAWMPHTSMNLGLDLQGGVHMVMGVDLDKVIRDQLASYGRTIERQATQDKIDGVKTTVIPERFELELTAPTKEAKDRLAAIAQKDFSNILTFIGETDTVAVLRMTNEFEADVRSRALEQSIATIRNRIDEFGVAEPVITRKGDSQILVQFPGAKESERLKDLIGQTAQLMFQMVHECTDMNCLAKQQSEWMAKIEDAEKKGSYNRETFKRLSEYTARVNADLKASLPADTTIAFERSEDVNVKGSVRLVPFLLSTKNIVSGEYIENAFVTLSSNSRNQLGPEMPEVSFQLNAVGAPVFGQMTTDYQHYFMAIVLDGIVKSAPSINSPIPSGQGSITLGRGSYDEVAREANDLAIVLRAGALPASIEVQEERTIGPSIGRDAISAGQRALGVACLIIFVFMAVYYGAAGWIANVVTLVNTGMIVAMLGAVGATLTLPGIAGIVLTLGMAVDALIIIFERMREEMRAGRNPRQIVHLGFDRAFSTILDSNVTTAIGGFVLLQYGTGSIRGFALTLLVGIITNVFMATFFTKFLFEYILLKNNDRLIGIGLSHKEIAGEAHA